jgi:diguanylate cyclase (GGDEF)-like protein
LRSFCREYDYVARMGGDEFVLIIPGMKAGAVNRKTQDLSAVVREAGREVTGEDIVSLSLGDAFFPEDGSDTEELLAEADRRMYQVKRSHRAGDTREASLGQLRETPVRTTAVQ